MSDEKCESIWMQPGYDGFINPNVTYHERRCELPKGHDGAHQAGDFENDFKNWCMWDDSAVSPSRPKD